VEARPLGHEGRLHRLARRDRATTPTCGARRPSRSKTRCW
jgi:hypothetical protein